nr:MAG TPA: hypothetical protein [Caudoviricetes sp.]
MGKIAGKIKSTSENSLSIQSPDMPIRCMQGTPFYSSPLSAVVRKIPCTAGSQ